MNTKVWRMETGIQKNLTYPQLYLPVYRNEIGKALYLFLTSKGHIKGNSSSRQDGKTKTIFILA